MRGSAAVAAAGGLQRRGSCGQGGRCVRASHATTATILSGKAGLLHPSCKKRNRAGLRRFPNRSPPHQGLDPATGLTPTPWEPAAGAAPRATQHPDGNKGNEGLPETRPWVPREVGGPCGRHHGGQRAML